MARKSGDDITLSKEPQFKILGEDFTSPHWRLDTEMLLVLEGETLAYDIVEVPTKTYERFTERAGEVQQGDQFQVRTTTSMDVVANYEASLAAGQRLPTPTIGQNGEEVDMYHRVLAALHLDIENLVCIRIKSDLHPWQRGFIATLRNNRHGLRMTTTDTLGWGKQAVANGWSVDETARKLNIDPSRLRREILVDTTRERARRLGVEDPFARLKRSTQYDLGNSGLHDRPFKEFVKLLDDFSPTVSKASTLLNEVMEAPSDTKQIDLIKTMRDRLAPPTLPTIGRALEPVTEQQDEDRDPERVLSFKDAARAFSGAYGPFAAVLQDEPVVTALLSGGPTTPGFVKIRKALDEMRESFEKLVAHFAE